MREKGHLLRVLGVAFGLAAVVGSMVGQGILRTPGLVAAAVHTPALIIATWVLGGLSAVIGSLAYIELGAAIPSAGGPYDYAEKAFGRLPAALTGWTLLLAMVASTAGVAYVVGEYVVRLGGMTGVSPAVPALVTVALFWALNMSGTRASGKVQVVFSALKGGILVALVVALFMFTGREPAAAVAGTTLAGPVGIAGLALAMRLIVSTYNGWQDIALYCEELDDPGRSLPRSMFGGLAAVMGIYVFFNLALLHVLTPAQMAASNLPGADAVALLLGNGAGQAMTLFGVLSVAAITSLSIMGTTRLTFAMARGGMLPSALASVSDNGTPRAALAVVVILTAMFVGSGTYDTLSSTSTSLYQMAVVAVLLSAVQLRRRHPDMPRPYRMPWYPVTITLALIANVALLVAFVYDDPFNALIGLGIDFALMLVWLVIERSRGRVSGE